MTFERSTILVGPNGAGKSTVLQALKFFFAPPVAAAATDFHGDCADDPVEITVTFADLLQAELEFYGRYCDRNGSLTVTKRCQAAGDSRYFVTTMAHAAFAEIRATEGANAQKAMFRTFALDNEDYGFEPVVKSVADMEEKLVAWEGLNPSKLEPSENPLPLGKQRTFSESTLVRYVPAVEAAKLDAQSPLRTLLEEAVRQPADARPDVAALRERTLFDAEALFDRANTPGFDEVAERFRARLEEFAPGSNCEVDWGSVADGVHIDVPKIDIRIVEDAFGGPPDGKGHGLQRALIFAAMRLEVERLTERDGQPRHLVLLVEEPEIYLHPTRMRHVAKTLQALSEEEGVSVVLATHSPAFARLRDFESIRVIRKVSVPEHAIPRRVVAQTTLAAVAAELQHAHDGNAGFTAEGVRARIAGILDGAIREGYFARRVVLCEGDQDQAIIMAAAEMQGLDLDAIDVALISANGKNNLDRPHVIFNHLGIETYVVFDGDQGNGNQDDAARTNRALLTLVGAASEDFPKDSIGRRHAVWNRNIETSLRLSYASPGAYDTALTVAAQTYGVTKRANKNPAVVRLTLENLKRDGHHSDLVANLGQAIEEFGRA